MKNALKQVDEDKIQRQAIAAAPTTTKIQACYKTIILSVSLDLVDRRFEIFECGFFFLRNIQYISHHLTLKLSNEKNFFFFTNYFPMKFGGAHYVYLTMIITHFVC